MNKFFDSLKEKAEDVIDKIDDKIDNVDLVDFKIDFKAIQKAGQDCFSTARDTSALCQNTIEKAQHMVEFGRELQTTLEDVCNSGNTQQRSLDASKFAIIQDLVDGDKIKEATQLAKDLSEHSLECVEKSKEMITAMESGIDALPDIVEPFVENKLAKSASKGSRKGDPELPDVQGSVRELKALVDDIETVNLFTVVTRGSSAFSSLRKNGELTKNMFGDIQTFANDVETVSDSFREFKPEDFKSVKTIGTIRKAAKSAWRCLRLSGLIRKFSEEVGALVQWMISLFQTASAKLGAIWGALANARKLLAECLDGVKESMKLCDESKSKSILLKNSSKEVLDHLRNILTLNKASMLASMVDLADGDEIRTCIELGTSIDDIFVECIQKVLGTIRKVDRAIADMPDVLKQDVPEVVPIENDNNDDDDSIEFEDYDFANQRAIDGNDDDSEANAPTPSTIRSQAISATKSQAKVRENVQNLETMTNKIESSSVLTVLQKSAEGFEGANEAIGLCQSLISGSRGYAKNCQTCIDSFNNGDWNLELATQHILEVFAIRDAGVAMKLLAECILDLVQANVKLMKSVKSRTKNLVGGSGGNSDSGDGGVNLGSLVQSIASDVDADDLKKLGQGLKKFGRLFR